MTTPKFDIEFEEDILANVLKDATYLKQASRLLESHHFATKQHAWIWTTAKGIWDNYKERASGRLLKAKLKADFPKTEDAEPYRELLIKLLKRKGAPKAALDHLELWARKVNAQVLMEEAARFLDKDDKDSIDKVYNIIGEMHRRQLKVKNWTDTRWIEEFEERQADRKHRREHPEDFKRIPTGFRRIDEILGGGIEIGEFGNIMATTGKGKSIMGVNISYGGASRGHHVLIISMEMPARQVNQRLDSRWLRMPYKKLKTFEFTPAELRAIQKLLKKAEAKFKGLVRVVSTPVRSMSVPGMLDILEDLRLDGFVPDMLFLDSADHMTAPKGKRYDSLRQEQSEIYWSIKGVAEEYGYAIWNTLQAGRDWVDKNATVEAASESYDKGRIADIVISLNTPKKKTRSTREMGGDPDDESDEEIAEREAKVTGDYMEAYLAKYRDGESKVVIPMDANFTRMHLDEADVEAPEEDDDE